MTQRTLKHLCILDLVTTCALCPIELLNLQESYTTGDVLIVAFALFPK